MARTFTTRFAVALAALLAGLSNARAQFTVTQDTIVSLDAGGTIREYTKAGALSESLAITGGFGTLTGLTVLGDQVYVSNSGGNVGRVDLTTGAVTSVFIATNGNEGLGDNGANLLAYNYSTGQVQEFTATGSPVQSINVANTGAGIDGWGSRIFVSELDGGSAIREFNQSGALVATITTGLPTGSITGLGYDPTADAYWVATGAGDDRIRAFSPAGTELVGFPALTADVVGLDFVPVPEPTTVLAVAAAALGLGAAARRRLRRPAATA
jgi:hypothetical protein